MSRTPALVLLLLTGLVSPAAAGSWSLGAHLGMGVVKSGSEGGSNTIWAVPSNVLTYQPAFRLGFGDSNHRNDVQVDLGTLVIEQAGSILSLTAASIAYQYTFMAESQSGPFVNATYGFYREGGASDVTTQPSFGMGAGYRRVTRDRHGAIRAEARFDYLKGDDEFARSQLRTFGIRLGFDLWL